MKCIVLSFVLSFILSSSLAAKTNTYAWVNKSVDLVSNEHYQFWSPTFSVKSTVSIENGKPTTKTEKTTNDTHTVTFKTKPFGKKTTGIYWSYYKLHVLDPAWTPEQNRKILEDIAAQVTKGFDLPLKVRKNENEVWHRMILLLNEEPVMTLCLEKLDAPNKYQFATSFIVPDGNK